LLAAEDQVALQSLLVEDKFSLDVCAPTLLLGEDVHDFEAGPHPEAVAAVDQLVDASVEATQVLELSVREPLSQPFKVDGAVGLIARLRKDVEAGEGAKGVAPVSLSEG